MQRYLFYSHQYPLPTPVGELRDTPKITYFSTSVQHADVPVADVEERVEKAENDDEPAEENDW